MVARFKRTVLAFLTEPIAIRRILDHLGLPTEGPRVASARAVRLPLQSEVGEWALSLFEVQLIQPRKRERHCRFRRAGHSTTRLNHAQDLGFHIPWW